MNFKKIISKLNFVRKNLALVLGFFVFFSVNLNAIPGVNSYIPDISGEYVYYRDYSFKRESYVGFLCYDEKTFQARYFSPQNSQENLPENEVAILVTIDSSANYWKMTGERIISSITPDSDDLDIVNYIHDLLYEFSARRIKAGDISPKTDEYKSGNLRTSGVLINQDYSQFGGKVDVLFDVIVPIFNVKSIANEEGNTIFECVTIGQMLSSDDTSFSDFKGFNKNSSEISDSNLKFNKKAKKIKAESAGQTVLLDENWKNEFEGCWTLGNEAIINMNLIQTVDELTGSSEYLCRRLLSGTSGSYTDFSTAEIIFNKKSDGFKIVSKNYQTSQNNNSVILNTKILTESQNGEYKYFSLACYEKAYENRRSYFEKILKSRK